MPLFGGTFFTLTGMHMLHVTIGVIYLGVIALRKKFLPMLLALWLIGWLATPADSVFHLGIHVLLVGAIISAVVLFLKPKDYDANDVEVVGSVLALRRPGLDVHFPAGVPDVDQGVGETKGEFRDA